MSIWSRQLTLAVMLATVLAAPSAAGDLGAAEKALNVRFKGKSATPKIDLPWRRSLYVDLDGRHDEARYYERIRGSEKLLRAGEALPIHHLEIDDDHINVCIGGPQCGEVWKPKSSKTVFVFGGPGYRIEIEFGRQVTAADATPEVVLMALARVLTIEGETPPAEFSTAAVLGNAAAVSAPGNAPAAVATSGSSSPASLAGTAGGVPAVGPSSLVLLSAEVQPTTTAPGSKLRLIAHFEVAGGGLPVTEERQLLLDERALLSRPTTTTQDWPAGRHSTEVEFAMPPGATPGVYVFRLTLRGGGTEQTKEALFQVR